MSHGIHAMMQASMSRKAVFSNPAVEFLRRQDILAEKLNAVETEVFGWKDEYTNLSNKYASIRLDTSIKWFKRLEMMKGVVEEMLDVEDILKDLDARSEKLNRELENLTIGGRR